MNNFEDRAFYWGIVIIFVKLELLAIDPRSTKFDICGDFDPRRLYLLNSTRQVLQCGDHKQSRQKRCVCAVRAHDPVQPGDRKQ
jgi:hypothetical protein